MKIKVPTYEVRMCVKINDEWHVHTYATNTRFTVALAKKYFANAEHWGDGWTDCKILEVVKGAIKVLEVPVNTLLEVAESEG